MGLQQFGVIPFEIRTLKKGHTEKWRARRILYNKAIVDAERHRWCVEEQRIFASFINVFVYFITKQWFARFLKTFFSKAISNTCTTPLSLFVPSAPPWYCLLSPPCSPPLCVTFICSRTTLSLHISEEPTPWLFVRKFLPCPTLQWC